MKNVSVVSPLTFQGFLLCSRAPTIAPPPLPSSTEPHHLGACDLPESAFLAAAGTGGSSGTLWGFFETNFDLVLNLQESGKNRAGPPVSPNSELRVVCICPIC